MVRRTIALLGAIVIVVLLVVGINSCLDSRKDSAFRDYASDVRALVNAEQDLSDRLFETLSKPGQGDALDVQTQVNAMRVTPSSRVPREGHRPSGRPEHRAGVVGDGVRVPR